MPYEGSEFNGNPDIVLNQSDLGTTNDTSWANMQNISLNNIASEIQHNYYSNQRRTGGQNYDDIHREFALD